MDWIPVLRRGTDMMKTCILACVFFSIMPALLLGQGGGYALEYDGIDDYVTLPANLADMGVSDAFTCMLWIKTNSHYDYRMLIEDGDSWPNNGIHLGVVPHHDRIFLRINTTETSYYNEEIYITPYRRKWSAIAYTFDGSAIHLYFNGEPVLQAQISGDVQSGNRSLWFGHREGMTPYVGILEEISIWNIALSTDEIRERMHCLLEGGELGLLGYYRFDEGAGEEAGDMTGNAFDGTLMGGPEWVQSTAPLGEGQSRTEIVGETDQYRFESVDLELEFTAKADTDTFVVTKINGAPAGQQPQGIDPIAPHVWIVKSYGNGTFTANWTFHFDEGVVSAEDLASPDNLKLFHREANSDSAWTEIAAASAVTDSSITFDNISTTGQFVIGRKVDSSVPDTEPSNIPDSYELRQNHPNPFNPSTVISYSIPTSGHVSLKVYDLLGREIVTLVEAFQQGGFHSVRFETEDLPGGIYLYQIRAGSFVQTRKMVLSR